VRATDLPIGSNFFFRPLLSLSLSASLSLFLLARRAISPIYFCRGRARMRGRVARGETRRICAALEYADEFQDPLRRVRNCNIARKEREREERGIALLFFDIYIFLKNDNSRKSAVKTPNYP